MVFYLNKKIEDATNKTEFMEELKYLNKRRNKNE